MADKHVSADGLIKLLRGRKYRWAQVHHTWRPNHANFTGKNHQSLQDGMRNYHVGTNGWSDIGQHATLFPDGTFITGRAFGTNPAGIVGYNAGAFMIEMIGDFDKGKDKLEGKQLNAALKVYQFLMNHCGATILFHNEKAAKSCPGTGVDKAKFVKAAKNFNGKTPNVSSSGGSTSKKSKWKKVGDKWTGQVLRMNDRGGAVKDLQKLVGVTADSMFGQATKSAVGKAQKKHGLTVDYTPGPDTYKALTGKKSSKKKSSGKKANLKVDGKAGKAFVHAVQVATGSKYTDSTFSSQPRNKVTEAFYSGITYGSKGSPSVGTLQRYIGEKVDDKLGPSTIRTLQKRMGTPQDGIISRPYSNVIAEAQKRLNQGRF